MAPHQAAVAQLFGDLSGAEQKQLLAVLGKLLAALSRRGIGGVQDGGV